GMNLRLRPANNTVYNDVCIAQYYANSPVLPVEFFVMAVEAMSQLKDDMSSKFGS
ncbi:hypothetical protein L9F63_026067, partial [Diploptera punctata]